MKPGELWWARVDARRPVSAAELDGALRFALGLERWRISDGRASGGGTSALS
ncbi:MAG: hypothetical protein M3Y87_04080 [Myxococcota bacterium]|nr:hypothetical protein [Myxococcota bacterium]